MAMTDTNDNPGSTTVSLFVLSPPTPCGLALLLSQQWKQGTITTTATTQKSSPGEEPTSNFYAASSSTQTLTFTALTTHTSNESDQNTFKVGQQRTFVETSRPSLLSGRRKAKWAGGDRERHTEVSDRCSYFLFSRHPLNGSLPVVAFLCSQENESEDIVEESGEEDDDNQHDNNCVCIGRSTYQHHVECRAFFGKWWTCLTFPAARAVVIVLLCIIMATSAVATRAAQMHTDWFLFISWNRLNVSNNILHLSVAFSVG